MLSKLFCKNMSVLGTDIAHARDSSKTDDLEEFVVSKQTERAMRRMLESRTCREALRAWRCVSRGWCLILPLVA